MTAQSDLWACRVCKSINSRRSNRCYSCHTPREAAEVNPADMPTIGAAPPVVHTGTYQSTEMRAVLVTLAGGILVAATLASGFLLWQVGSLQGDGEHAAAEELWSGYGPYLAALPVLGVVALVAYAAWISRMVTNLPALGLGYSRVSGQMAFIEPLIPGFNLWALPARMGELLKKLDEKGSGMALLGLAVILVVAPPIVTGVLLRYLAPRSFNPTRLRSVIDLSAISDELVRTGSFFLLLTSTLVAVGLVIGMSLIWRLERQARGLAEERARNPKAATAQR